MAPVPATAGEARLGRSMRRYWAAFARHGTPDPAGEPAWPPSGADIAGVACMLFADVPRAVAGASPCAFPLHEEIVRRRRRIGSIPWNWNVGVAAPPAPPGDAS